MLSQTLRNLSRTALRCSPPITNAATRVSFQFRQPVRFMATGSTLTKEDVLARSISVLNSFAKKTSGDQIVPETEFIKDLGMDSLDYNDALVALEEEFDIVFDDKAANEIRSVGQCVDYVLANYMPTQETLDHEIR